VEVPECRHWVEVSGQHQAPAALFHKQQSEFPKPGIEPKFLAPTTSRIHQLCCFLRVELVTNKQMKPNNFVKTKRVN
jgi:hypothetical protein